MLQHEYQTLRLSGFLTREITPIGFRAFGAPISRLFLAPSKNKDVVKLHLTLILFQASGLLISPNSHDLTSKTFEWFTFFEIIVANQAEHDSVFDRQRAHRRGPRPRPARPS